jgi:protein phosphatase
MFERLWRRFRNSEDDRSSVRSDTDHRDVVGEDSDSFTADITLGVKQIGQVSICGNHREHNEDNLFVAEVRDRLPLYIVADGMGGQLGGEFASRMAVEIIPRELQKRSGPEGRSSQLIQAIRESISQANHEILASSHIQPHLNNMGTTVVQLVVHRGRAFVAGIGDSRCYRFRSRKIELLTRDHSMAQALAEVGTIRQEDVSSHRYNHVLYLYLGSREVDRGATDVKVLTLLDGDRFLLCSDGLSGVVSEKEMVEILQSEPNAQRAADRLVELAETNRSRDNITCVVVDIGRVSDLAESASAESGSIENGA